MAEKKNAIVAFFQSSISEMKKVTWPSQEEVIGSTWVVLITVIIVALILYFMDWGVSQLVAVILDSLQL